MPCERNRDLEVSSFIIHVVLQQTWGTSLWSSTRLFLGSPRAPGDFPDGLLGLRTSPHPACFRKGFLKEVRLGLVLGISGRGWMVGCSGLKVGTYLVAMGQVNGWGPWKGGLGMWESRL